MGGGGDVENGETALQFADNIIDKNFQEEMEYLASQKLKDEETVVPR